MSNKIITAVLCLLLVGGVSVSMARSKGGEIKGIPQGEAAIRDLSREGNPPEVNHVGLGAGQDKGVNQNEASTKIADTGKKTDSGDEKGSNANVDEVTHQSLKTPVWQVVVISILIALGLDRLSNSKRIARHYKQKKQDTMHDSSLIENRLNEIKQLIISNMSHVGVSNQGKNDGLQGLLNDINSRIYHHDQNVPSVKNEIINQLSSEINQVVAVISADISQVRDSVVKDIRDHQDVIGKKALDYDNLVAEKSALESEQETLRLEIAALTERFNNTVVEKDKIESQLAEVSERFKEKEQGLASATEYIGNLKKVLPIESGVDEFFQELAKHPYFEGEGLNDLQYLGVQLANIAAVKSLELSVSDKRVMVRDAFQAFDRALYARFKSNPEGLQALRDYFAENLKGLLLEFYSFQWPRVNDHLDLQKHRQSIENGEGIIKNVQTAVLIATDSNEVIVKAVVDT